MSDKKLNVYERINAVMKELPYIKKGAEVGFGRNTYTAIQHDDVTEKAQPLFVKHGLIAVPKIVEYDCQHYRVTTKNGEADRYETRVLVELSVMNVNKPEECVVTNAFAHGFDSQDKSPGKAYSMAVKYCYLKLLMIASGDREEERPTEAQKQPKMSVKDLKGERTKLKNLLIKNGKYTDATKEKFDAYIEMLDKDTLAAKIKENWQ